MSHALELGNIYKPYGISSISGNFIDVEKVHEI